MFQQGVRKLCGIEIIPQTVKSKSEEYYTMKEKVMNGLEKFSKAMLSPLSYISAAGLILVLGALLTSTSLSAMIPALQWTPIKLLGQLIYNCIMVIINNLSLMFCVGIAAALAKKNKQQAAIIGLMSYFMYLTAGNVTLTQLGMLAEADPMVGLYGTGQSTVFGIQTVDMGVFGGILLGLVCGWVYNRTCEKQFKGIITQIYSGNRWSFTCMVVFSILFGFGSCFFWPPVQNVISALTDLIATSGNFGLFLYGFLERFLIPTGLHHLIYTPFQFSALGNSLTVGDATYTGSYIVMMMEYSMVCPSRTASCGCTPASPRPSATLASWRPSSSAPARRTAKRPLPFWCRWPLPLLWLPSPSRWTLCSASLLPSCGWHTPASPACSSCCCTSSMSPALPPTSSARC